MAPRLHDVFNLCNFCRRPSIPSDVMPHDSPKVKPWDSPSIGREISGWIRHRGTNSRNSRPALGHLVRLIPLQLNELPTHPEINAYLDESGHRKHSSSSSNSTHSNAPSNPLLDRFSHPKLTPFIEEVLDEAVFFCDTMPGTFKQKTKPHTRNGLTIFQRDIKSQEISTIPFTEANVPRKTRFDSKKMKKQKYGESWFARISRHRNTAESGTATHEELVDGIRLNHSRNEKEYTPDVFDARYVLKWDTAESKLHPCKYLDVTMEIREMCHRLPWPLEPRVFQVLVITARVPGAGMYHPRTGGSVVVQIPVDLKALPQAFYGSGKHLTEGKEEIMRQKMVFGTYTSIERLLPVGVLESPGIGAAEASNQFSDHSPMDDPTHPDYVPDMDTNHSSLFSFPTPSGHTSPFIQDSPPSSVSRYAPSLPFSEEEGGEHTVWIMCTASDAKGVLPVWLQKPALPSAIAKDVPLFMEWQEKKRKEDEEFFGPGHVDREPVRFKPSRFGKGTPVKKGSF